MNARLAPGVSVVVDAACVPMSVDVGMSPLTLVFCPLPIAHMVPDCAWRF